jgi:signal transduction histidine kinase
VRHVLTNVSGGSSEPFEISIKDDLDLIWGDSDRIHQVVTNLVENAMRHGFGLREVVVQNTRHPEYAGGVSLQIHDNGPGIPVEMRQRVFSRFWRAGPGAGSGLGMYRSTGERSTSRTPRAGERRSASGSRSTSPPRCPTDGH